MSFKHLTKLFVGTIPFKLEIIYVFQRLCAPNSVVSSVFRDDFKNKKIEFGINNSEFNQKNSKISTNL